MSEPILRQRSVTLPPLCEQHIHDVHCDLRLPPDNDAVWQACMLLINLLMYQWAMTEPRITRRMRSIDDASPVLAEIGCLACYSPRTFRAAEKVMRKGAAHARSVYSDSVADPDWRLQPVPAHLRPTVQ